MTNILRVTFCCFLLSNFAFCQTAIRVEKLRDSLVEYYSSKNEPLKVKASNFLLDNISLHSGEYCHWISADGAPADFNELNYPDYISSKQKLSELTNKGMTYKLDTTADINKINAKLLIDNIDLAFKAWKTNPWSSSYNYEIFAEYILPHRSTTEPVQNWRDDYKWFYDDVRAEHIDTTDPIEVCKSLLHKNKSFTVNLSRKDPLPILGPNHILFRNEGSCHEIANLNIFASRSLGLATTFDFVPHWAASSNRHMWNTTIDANGRHLPYDRDNFPFSTKKRIGKVLRYTYSSQPEALANLIDSNMIPSDIFRKKNIKDVTSEYVEVGSINYSYHEISSDVAYLNVFNKGLWKMTDWAKVINRGCTFKNLGKNVVYLPSRMEQGNVVHEKSPILLKEDGNTTYLTPNLEQTFDCVLSRNNETNTEYEENNTTVIDDGENYHLVYWYGKWVYHASSTAIDNSVSFINVPTNALFALIPNKPDQYERPFIINPTNNKITWY